MVKTTYRFFLPSLLVLLAAITSAVLVGLGPGIAPARAAPSAWVDEFTRKETRWDWAYIKGAGYRTLVTSPVPSAVKIGVTSAASATSYSDCSLHEKSPQYRTGILEMRLKASDQQVPNGAGKGTRGWGFWDGNTSKGNAAWFWSASSESDPLLQGFRTQVFRNGVLEHNKTLAIDMRAWHVYRIELYSSQVVFKVDGKEVARIGRVPATLQRVEMWIDNYKIKLTSTGYTKGYVDITQDQNLVIDWVRYTPIP